MKKVFIEIDRSSYQDIKNFLLQDGMEHAVFLLARQSENDLGLIFKIQNYRLVSNEEIDSSSHDLRLKDKAQSKIVKWAWDNKACLIEIHSHPFTQKGVGFSSYDLDGFKEFVPYVWWRLKGKPYIAIVQGKQDYDALVWLENPTSPKKIGGIITDSIVITPTNRTATYGTKH